MSLATYFYSDYDRIIDEYHNTVCVEVANREQMDWFHGTSHNLFGRTYLEISGLHYCVRQAWEVVEEWFLAGYIDEPMRTMYAYLFQMTENGYYWNPEFTLPLYKDPEMGVFIEAPVDQILFQFLQGQTPLSAVAVLECPHAQADDTSLLTEMNDLYDPYVVDMYEFEWNHGGGGVPNEVMEAALEVDPTDVRHFLHDENPNGLFRGAGTEDDPIDLISTDPTVLMSDDDSYFSYRPN